MSAHERVGGSKGPEIGRLKLESLGIPYIGYDVEVVDVNEIAREQIIDSVDDRKK